MRRIALSLLFCVLSCAAQQAVTFEGRPALLLANGRLELTVLMQGGAMASLVLGEDAEKLNPLWNPVRMAREIGRKPPGGAGIGHFVCVDGFGPVSREEQAAGMPGHGEAHSRIMSARQAREGKTLTLTLAATLPLVQEVFTRQLRMVDGENVVYVDGKLESLLGFDRPVNWAEHATIGAPFLEREKTVIDMSGSRCKTRSYVPGAPLRRLASFADFTWPFAPGAKGERFDLRAASAAPAIGHTTCLVDPERRLGWVTALHPGKRLLLGYVFRREEFPWLQNWENYPPEGNLARGMEFSTQPFDVPRREAIQTNSLFGAPTYRWLPAKSNIESRFLLFYTKAPEGFTKVDDVTLENGKLVIVDRRAGKRIELTASLPL